MSYIIYDENGREIRVDVAEDATPEEIVQEIAKAIVPPITPQLPFPASKETPSLFVN